MPKVNEEIEDIEDELEEEEETEDRGDDFEGYEENEEDLEDGDSVREDGDSGGHEEDDDTDDEDADAGDDEDDASDDSEEGEEEDKENYLPQSRFNEVIKQREYEREQNENLRRQNDELISLLKQDRKTKKEEEVPKFDFAKAEEGYMEAVLEGEVKEAQSIRANIRKAERQLFLEEAKGLRDEAVNSAKEEAGRLDDETKFTRAVKQNEESYPFLDNRATEYNQGAVDEVNDLYGTFVTAGLSKSAAIQKAVDLISPKYGVSKPKIGEEKTNNRRKKAVKKNASAQNRQPNKMKGRSARDKALDEFDVNRMSDSQFSKLSKREKAELRGDSV